MIYLDLKPDDEPVKAPVEAKPRSTAALYIVYSFKDDWLKTTAISPHNLDWRLTAVTVTERRPVPASVSDGLLTPQNLKIHKLCHMVTILKLEAMEQGKVVYLFDYDTWKGKT